MVPAVPDNPCLRNHTPLHIGLYIKKHYIIIGSTDDGMGCADASESAYQTWKQHPE